MRTKQFAAALQELQAGAEHGDVQSQYLLGLVNANGIGVPVSTSSAKRWAAAPAKSHAEAAFALAGLLAEGRTEERAEATEWLARAAREGHPIAVRLVAAHALPLAPSHSPNGDKELARELLIWAVHKQDAPSIDAFAKVAGVDVEDEFGRTPLEYAVIDGSEPVVKHLLAVGAQGPHADQAGVTALMLAADGESPAVLEAVIHATADPNAKDHAGNTALDHAARDGRLDFVERLLSAGSRTDVENADGWTPLDVALKCGHADIALSLRKAGATGNFKAGMLRESSGTDIAHGGEMYKGWSPIAIAVSRNEAKLVQDQLTAGALPDELTPQRDALLRLPPRITRPP